MKAIERRAQAQVFGLTWVTYASYYLCRKPLSVVKARLADDFQLSLATLSAIDTGYLLAYALGQFASGLLCDALGPRRLLGAGMFGVAGACTLFGAGSTTAVFAIAFAANGLLQSTGWPGTVKAMTLWFSTATRGKVMGLWSTCYQVGGVAATALATVLLTHVGWRSTFFVPAAWLAALGVAVLLLMKERPAAAPSARKGVAASIEALRDPAVWNLGAAYFGLKLIRYSLLFWLPLYLHRELRYSEGSAGYLSISLELGGVLGAIAAGAVSDRLAGRRGPVMVVLCFALAGAMLVYSRAATLGAVPNFLAMALVGFALFGPDTMVSATAAQDLGGEAAAGTAAGIINGIGSAGAVAQGTLTAYVAAVYGWPTLFRVFVVLAVACGLVLLPFALRENLTRDE